MSKYFETPQGQALLKDIESGVSSGLAVTAATAAAKKEAKVAGKKRTASEVERERRIEEISYKIDKAQSMEEVQALQKELELIQDQE